MLSARVVISNSSILGFFLFLVISGSYGLAFLPEPEAFRSLVVLMVFAISLCSFILAIKSFLASALLTSYQVLVVFSVVLYAFLSLFHSYEFEVSRISLWLSASIWAGLLWSNVPFLIDWYEKSLFLITVVTLVLILFIGSTLEEYTLTSRNYWSFVLVPLLGVLFFLKYIRSEKVSVLLCFLVFLVSVFTQGRSGILSSSLILVSSFIYSLGFLNKFLNRFLFLFGLLVLFALAVTYTMLNGFFDYVLTKGLADHARTNIIFEYLKNLNGFFDYVSGVSFNLISSASEFNYNLHNTFLYFHSRFGVYFFIIFFLVLLAFVRSFLNRYWVLLLVFFAIFLRFSTDTGWGFNSMAIHIVCIHGLAFIFNAFFEVKKEFVIPPSTKKIN